MCENSKILYSLGLTHGKMWKPAGPTLKSESWVPRYDGATAFRSPDSSVSACYCNSQLWLKHS